MGKSFLVKQGQGHVKDKTCGHHFHSGADSWVYLLVVCNDTMGHTQPLSINKIIQLVLDFYGFLREGGKEEFPTGRAGFFASQSNTAAIIETAIKTLKTA